MSALSSAPSDSELVTKAVHDFARKTRFPVAFGGLVEDGSLTISTIVGNRTEHLRGLSVRADRGLGGRAMSERRPRMTSDYGKSQQITHDYDTYILGEGLRTLLAVPIVVDGRTRGVLYGGAWEETVVGGVVTTPAIGVADTVATELRVRDEVARRLRDPAATPNTLSPHQRDELRESYAELRSIAAHITDDALRHRLMNLEQRILGLTGDSRAPHTGAIPTVHLSRRELDVLACVALGETNAAIAQQLGLREGTVKAYLGAAMQKLDAPTRHAAVHRARRAGLLP